MLQWCANADDGVAHQRRHTLRTYYSLADQGGDAGTAGGAGNTPVSASCDINGPNFEPDAYLNRLIKERSLTELMDKEAEMVQHIKSLDSDMQTLVYENYNKFISATDTIRTVLFTQFLSVYLS